MRKSSHLKKDVITTIIVLVIVSAMLGIANYQKLTQGKEASAKQIASSITLTDKKQSEQINLFTSQEALSKTFPTFQANIDWSKQVVITYVGLPQASSDYHLKLDSVKRTGDILNIAYSTYQVGGANLTTGIREVRYPCLFLSIDKSELVAGSDLNIQLIESSSGHTKTLKLPPNEI